jgi:TRAP-type C4-dicarboxylate transport system substrate-binding protein
MRAQRWLLLLAASGTLLAGCDFSTNKATGAREVSPVVLTLANPHPGDLYIGEWVQAVERLSHGAVRIEVRGGWRRGEVLAERRALGDVRAGRVDLAHIPARAWDTLGVNSLQALEAPLLVDSLWLQERVLMDPLGASMLAGVRRAGVEPVALLPGLSRRPVGVSGDLLGPGDYRGTTIGLRPSAVHEATLRALGARPVRVAAGGRLHGLDGTEADLASMDFDRYDLQARSTTADVVLWPHAMTLVMNRAAWRRMDARAREVLRQAPQAAVGPVVQRVENFERGGAQSLCDRGFSLARAGASRIAALRRAVEPVYRQLARDAATRRALERIRALKATAPAGAIPSCEAEPGGIPGPRAAPLVGSWRAHVSRELLVSARREQGETIDDSWGNLTLVLDRAGRFRLLNDRFPGQHLLFGTWHARGDVLTFTPGGTLEQGAGEMWRYRWTLFRGSLVLRKLSVGPTALTVAPLHRD